MQTITQIIEKTAAEMYPGTAFASELKLAAENLLATELSKASRKALRKAILSYRPPAPAPAIQQGSKPTTTPAPSSVTSSASSPRGTTI